jgi:hypothetical protein
MLLRGSIRVERAGEPIHVDELFALNGAYP